MFSLALKAGRLAYRPHVPMLMEDNASPGIPRVADFVAVRGYLPEYLADAATFAYLTGWRKGEVRTLEWRDVDSDVGVVRLRAEHSKNKRPRAIALRGELRTLAAVERTDAYVTERREARRRVVPLDARRGREHGQNTDNPAAETALSVRSEAVTA
jgi:hypothetical protein